MAGEWKQPLLGCFSNFSVCLVAFLMPCYTAGKNAESVGSSCFLCGLASMLPVINCLTGADTRGKIRQEHGLPGSFVTDCLTVVFCYPCAMTQEAVQVQDPVGQQEMERQ